MARVETVLVSSTKPFEATGPDGSMVTVKNLGPDSCVFATASTVSAGSNDGTLTSGSSLAFAPSKFFLSSGTSNLQVTTAVGDQFRQYDKDNRQVGVYAPPVPSPTSTVTVAANRGYLMRFAPSRPMTITTIAFAVTTIAGADDNVDVGIYNAAGTLLVSSGATAGKLTGLGAKTVTVTGTALTAGTVYYAGLSVGALGGTAAVIAGVGYTAVGCFALNGATIGLVEADAKAATHPLPASWGALSGLTAAIPWVSLRES